MRLHLLLSIVLPLALVCSVGLPRVVSATTADNMPETVVLQLKWMHQFQFAGYYAALEKGFYREAGLDVVLKEARPGMDITGELLVGRADYLVNNPSALLARAEGKPLVALAAIFQHSPLVMISRKDAQIMTPTDLIGRRTMFIRETESELVAMCADEGVKLEQIDTLPHSWDINDLIDGTADAMSAYLTDAPFLLQKKRGSLQPSPSTYLRHRFLWRCPPDHRIGNQRASRPGQGL